MLLQDGLDGSCPVNISRQNSKGIDKVYHMVSGMWVNQSYGGEVQNIPKTGKRDDEREKERYCWTSILSGLILITSCSKQNKLFFLSLSPIEIVANQHTLFLSKIVSLNNLGLALKSLDIVYLKENITYVYVCTQIYLTRMTSTHLHTKKVIHTCTHIHIHTKKVKSIFRLLTESFNCNSL